MKVRTMNKSEGAACHISEYPSFSVTGSIKGMKKLYYGKDALLVRCGSYIYHVPESIYYRAH